MLGRNRPWGLPTAVRGLALRGLASGGLASGGLASGGLASGGLASGAPLGRWGDRTPRPARL